MNMKHVLPLLVGVASLSFHSAQAQLLFSEGFNYTVGGNLGGQVNPGNSTAWSSGAAGSITIASVAQSYTDSQNDTLLNNNANSLSDAWGTSGSTVNTYANQTSGSVYYSFLLDMTAFDGANDYITSLNPGTTAPGGSADALAVYMYSGTSAGDIGLRTDGIAAIHVPNTQAMALNTTYLVVVQYSFATTTANLWLDPIIGGSSAPTPSLTLAGNGSVTAIDDVGFKSQATTGDFDIANMLIGTTWASVTPEVTVTPEPSTFALAGIGMGLTLLARFRRR
jgi:hypothetical protein